MKGVYFGDVHSYNDLNLVLTSISIPPAKPKTNFVDIPAGDGSIDLTEALGDIRYYDRECSFVFTVFPSDDFEAKKKEVSNLINGKRMEIRVDKDQGYYWQGRCAVNEYKSNKNIHQIAVKATVSPYKLKNSETVVTVAAGADIAVTLTNGRKKVVPVITCDADTVLVYKDTTYNISAGTHKLLDIQLVEGENALTVVSDGDVTFTYQEGDL